jgi:tetrahydromethanopterin:alpha-L-glutamate ligase
VRTPPTWACESLAQARAVLMRETAAGHDVVAKPLFGSQGKGLMLVGATPEGWVDLPEEKSGHHYLQRFLPAQAQPGHDWRVLVIGGRAVAAMRRVSAHWVHNVAQGARCEAAELTPALARIAEAASAALDLDYAGVDVMPSGTGLQVLEVNGVAAWRGLQQVTPFNIAQALVDDLVDRKMAGRPKATHLQAVPHRRA